MDSPKRKHIEPNRQCQYGTGCYRKNPQHFSEFAHQHLSDIRQVGRSATGSYTVPDSLSLSREIVLEQLQILDRLYPRDENPSKQQKLDPAATSNKDKPIAPITADQLRNGLAQAVTSTAAKMSTDENSMPAGASSTSQADQLAAYRARHVQQRPTASQQITTTTGTPAARPPPPRNIHDYISVVNPRGQMANKLAAAAPYNFFLTTITASKITHSEPLSITLQEILDESLGVIESSVQMNFMIDIGWLLGHYYFAGCLDKPMLVLYGDETPELQTISTRKPQITAMKVQMSSPFGTHHTKMMLLGYADGAMRVVVSTANLVEDDWHNRTQGIWLSPACPRMPADADTASGAGPTNFRDDLLRYLIAYGIPRLQPWIARIRQTDFSAVNVFFVASIPGGHRQTPAGPNWGHPRLGHLLGQHCAPVDDSCPVVAQCSSIGSLGPNAQAWIGTDIVPSFRRDSAPNGLRRLPPFRLVYPSYANVRNSHDQLLGGGCLPYRRAIDAKQCWLREHLQQWRCAARHRSRAMPHIKTYCRWSARGLYWFCLTSANLSKAAWGAYNKGTSLDTPLRVMSYEAGVLFLPKFVLGTGERWFPLDAGRSGGQPVFPMPYDIELQPYASTDVPFVMDYLLEAMNK